MRHIFDYLNKIERGEIKVSRYVKQAYTNLVPILDGKDNRYYYNEKLGQRPIDFIQKFCIQNKGIYKGEKLKLIPHQLARREALYGILHRDTQCRKFKETFYLVAKKNGKSMENGADALYLMAFDYCYNPLKGKFELFQGSHVKTAAKDLAQTEGVFMSAANMIDQSGYLQQVFTKTQKIIKAPQYLSTFEPLPRIIKDDDRKDGMLLHGLVIDEVHTLDRGVYEVLSKASIDDPNGMTILSSTEGTKRSGLLDDKKEQALKILNGETNIQNIFPLLYVLDEDDDWEDETVWQKANPALGYFKNIQSLRDELEKAKADPKDLIGFKTKFLNIEAGSSTSWIPAHYITKNVKQFEPRKDTIAVIGVDFGKSGDMTAVNILTYDMKNNEVQCETMYWVCLAATQENTTYAKMISLWAKQGYIRISGNQYVEQQDILDYIEQKRNELRVAYIYYDRWEAKYFAKNLLSIGFDSRQVIDTGQGFALSPAMREMEGDIKTQRLNFNNNPVTKWCLTNCDEKYDIVGNKMLVKSNLNRNKKIDGAAAILDSYAGFLQHKDEILEYCRWE